jgi:hypothetical protein
MPRNFIWRSSKKNGRSPIKPMYSSITRISAVTFKIYGRLIGVIRKQEYKYLTIKIINKMKKVILTLIAITVVVLGTSNFTYAATNNTNVITTLTNIGSINKIEVRGNVEVFVSTGEKDQVKVNNNYYAESAFVQDQNGVLRISSYKAEKLVLYVTASNLQSIAAYDNAVVVSNEKLSLISLDVNLFNNAYANLDLNNYATNVTVNDQAKADLTGSITEYSLTYNTLSNVNRTELIAQNVSETKVASKQVVTSAQKVDSEVVIVE